MKRILFMAMMLAASVCMTAQTTAKSGNTTRTLKVSTQATKTQQTKQAQQAKQTTKPFKGTWANKEGDMYLEMDLYAKSIGVEYGEPSHGALTVYYMNSHDINDIQSATITGNTATLNLTCQMGGNNGKVTVKLTYNPKNKTITVSNAKLLDDNQCILDGIDPIVLYKKK